MKIVRVDCHVLFDPDYDAEECSSAQDDLVVEVRRMLDTVKKA